MSSLSICEFWQLFHGITCHRDKYLKFSRLQVSPLSSQHEVFDQQEVASAAQLDDETKDKEDETGIIESASWEVFKIKNYPFAIEKGRVGFKQMQA